MLKSDFYYELPEELIAQEPIEPRDASRLLVFNRKNGELNHDYFYNIADYLNQGDLLVMNDSKVFPARLLGKKRGSDISAELLLLEQKDETVWETLVYPGRRLKKGAMVEFSDADLTAQILETVNDGNRLVKFDYTGDFFEILDKIGNMPLPPYITEKLQERSRYNTIYAEKTGSAAAPTAGLHFTERVFKRLLEKGVDTAYVTLHVGVGTFRPVKSEKIEEHKMHSERFYIPEETIGKIHECRSNGGRVVSVGTTSCRTLESVGMSMLSMRYNPNWSDTDIFIKPGYKFKVVDSLVTNFHLPESTLLMLVSAFMGREAALDSYHTAIREKYRFFSFGDSMMIL